MNLTQDYYTVHDIKRKKIVKHSDTSSLKLC